MTTKRAPKPITADDIRYAVRLAQRERMLFRRRLGGGFLRDALREAASDRKRGLKLLAAAGLDEYGYPLGAVLTPEEEAVRVLDNVERLPRREQSDTTRDGFETLHDYIDRITLDDEWAKRVPLVHAAALAKDHAALVALVTDPWAGWDRAVADGWRAMRVPLDVAIRLDARGVTPELLAPIVGMVRSLPKIERHRAIHDIEATVRHGADLATW